MPLLLPKAGPSGCMPPTSSWRSNKGLLVAPLVACALVVYWAYVGLGRLPPSDTAATGLPLGPSIPTPATTGEKAHEVEGAIRTPMKHPMYTVEVEDVDEELERLDGTHVEQTSEENRMSQHQKGHRVIDIPPAPLPRIDVAAEALGVLLMSQPENDDALEASTIRLRMAAMRAFIASSDELRKGWREHLDASEPRGILVPAGRATAVVNAFVMLHTLRHTVGCRLPVVLAHWGEREIHPGTRLFFSKHIPGIDFLDLSTLPYPSHHLPLNASGTSRRHFGYKLKVWALYNAPFREVIFLDSDSMPLQDPEILFDLDIYQKHGSIFWPDFWREKVVLWDALGLLGDPWADEEEQIGIDNDESSRMEDSQDDTENPEVQYVQAFAAGNRRGRESSAVTVHLNALSEAHHRMTRPLEAEAGQGVLDRSRWWEVIEWLLFLNTHSAFTYQWAMGDKDTFRTAFALASSEADYFQTPWAPSLPLTDLGADTPEAEVRYWNLGMIQLHPVDGSPMFHHRTADAKFLPGKDAGPNAAPITHVTPSVTQDQASIMIWGAPGQTLSHSDGKVMWGLRETSVFVVRCKTGLHALHEADRTCIGRSGMEQEMHPEPVTAIIVPKNSHIRKVSEAEAAAYALVPFQEDLE